MKALARRFKVAEEMDENRRYELRLMPRPILRYSDPDTGLTDGAVFIFAFGTNPEVVLVIECRRQESGRNAWYYGFTRLATAAVTARLGGRVVWNVPLHLGRDRLREIYSNFGRRILRKSDSGKFDEAVDRVRSGRSDTIDAREFPVRVEEHLPLLKDLSGLRNLYLDNSVVTDASLKNLEDLSSLERLMLSKTDVSDAGLAHLRRFKNLQTLVLDQTGVTDEGLEHLKPMQNLRFLSLWRTNITDRGVARLKHLSRLERLSLDETQITDAALDALKQMTRLRYLSIWNTKVTDAAVEKLQKALPALKINR